MTEAEWLASDDPQAMLDWLTSGLRPDISNRKRRLLQDACPRLFKPGACWAASEGARMAGLLRDIVGNPYRPAGLPRNPHCQVCGGSGSFVIGSGEDAERMPCRCCPWVTSTVLTLAAVAYQERPGRKCGECDGHGHYLGVGPGRGNPQCGTCHGVGRIEDGTLDPLTLAVLADALEEAGCDNERCKECHGSGTYTVEVRNAALSAMNGYGAATTYSEWRGCRRCGGDHNRKGRGYMPHPILAHLRSPAPHVRGCWAVDLVLGKE